MRECDTRDNAPPPPHDPVDCGGFLVGAHVPGEGDKTGAGSLRDQVCDFRACDGDHVHAHRILGVELQPDKDTGAGNKRDNIGEFPMRGCTLCCGAEFVIVRLHPVATCFA